MEDLTFGSTGNAEQLRIAIAQRGGPQIAGGGYLRQQIDPTRPVAPFNQRKRAVDFDKHQHKAAEEYQREVPGLHAAVNELTDAARPQGVEDHQYIKTADHNNSERRHLHQRRYVWTSVRKT